MSPVANDLVLTSELHLALSIPLSSSWKRHSLSLGTDSRRRIPTKVAKSLVSTVFSSIEPDQISDSNRNSKPHAHRVYGDTSAAEEDVISIINSWPNVVGNCESFSCMGLRRAFSETRILSVDFRYLDTILCSAH